MIEINWNEKKAKSLENKLLNIIKKLPSAAKVGVEASIEATKREALKNKKGSKNENMILTKILDANNEKVIGRVFTNKDLFSFAPFLEYGTGTYAEMPHIGKSKTFLESGFRFWYAPATSVNKSYSLTDFMIVDGVFYPMITQFHGKTYVMCFEQKSRPFMRPAGVYSREEAKKIISTEIKQMFNEVLK